MLLSLNQFKSVFSKTSKLCVTDVEVTPVFVGCCVISITAYAFFLRKRNKLQRKILKYMGPSTDPCGTSNKISTYELS